MRRTQSGSAPNSMPPALVLGHDRLSSNPAMPGLASRPPTTSAYSSTVNPTTFTRTCARATCAASHGSSSVRTRVEPGIGEPDRVEHAAPKLGHPRRAVARARGERHGLGDDAAEAIEVHDAGQLAPEAGGAGGEQEGILEVAAEDRPREVSGGRAHGVGRRRPGTFCPRLVVAPALGLARQGLSLIAARGTGLDACGRLKLGRGVGLQRVLERLIGGRLLAPQHREVRAVAIETVQPRLGRFRLFGIEELGGQESLGRVR